MKSIKSFLLVVILFLLFTGNTLAQATPEKGSAERKAIVNALRENVKDVKGLKGNIVFIVNRLQMQKGWAFIVAAPKSADDKPLMKFQEWCEFDQDIIALLRKRGKVWRVVARDVCPSDVSYGDWNKKYGAPRSILGL